MNIKTLRKKAHDGSLEVEDLLLAAIERQPGLSDELARLTVDHDWQLHGRQQDGTRVVPFARWAAVASAYASGGFAGLRLCAQEIENVSFVLGLVEQIPSNESVSFVLELCGQYLADLAQSEDLAIRVASAFNMLLSFKQSAPVTTDQAKAIQNYLLALYPLAKSEAQRASVLLALRGVGDQKALQFVASVPDFDEPWGGTKNAVLRAIRKRVKESVL